MSEAGAAVIIGTGQGGFQAAASLRDEGFGGAVTLVGDEPDLPYQRPPLSKAYLSGKADVDLVRLRPERFYSEHRVTVRTGTRAAAIDRAGRRVVLESGERLDYDHLVLATGAHNRPLPVPGSGLEGVLQLRSLQDADAIRRQLEGARRAVVVGGGFIGLEFAAVAAERGLEVTVVEAASRLMSRAVSPAVSSFVQSTHERRGIRFLLETAVTEITGGQRVSGVGTADGRHLPADLVVIGIGVLPNTALAAEAGLEIANGIVVDEHLLTRDPAISAIGDCASFPCRHAGNARVRLESVQNAVDQARCVAARLVGRAAPYAALPWFWSDQGALKLQIAGLCAPHDRAVLRPDPAKRGLSVFCYRGDRLIGVESVNRPVEHIHARKLLAAGIEVAPEQACDPGFDLKAHAAGPQRRA
ncbi:MAG TPA: FAD-dependent oxidoreductase [Acetobacteraceae bacterium]|nr:FAD-dependent oxidoreductase [Acetobacteraceae bacterium]